MRALRNPIGAIGGFLVSGMLMVQLFDSGTVIAQETKTAQVSNSYFPLAVGNSWTYRCSVEGQFQFVKTSSVTSVNDIANRHVYRMEMRIGKDTQPLVTYLSVEANGSVATAVQPEADAWETLVTAAPHVGEKIGQFTVAAKERLTMKALPSMDAVRLENFSADNPDVPEAQRLEWRSRTYGRGVGLLEEADGLGGVCTLAKFTHPKAK